MVEQGWPASSVRVRKIHETYIGTILIAIIIVLVSVRWHDIKYLAELLSFALTLSSLLLAVVAIAYAIYSNTAAERSVASLLTAASKVEATASDVSASSTSLATDVASLSELTGTIRTRLDAQHTALQEISEPIKTTSPPGTPKTQLRWSREDALRVLGGMSLFGLDGLLIVTFCAEHNVAVDLAKIEADNLIFNDQYVYGYLNAIDACGLIDIHMEGTVIERASSPHMTYHEVDGVYRDLIERWGDKSMKSRFLSSLNGLEAKLTALIVRQTDEKVGTSEGA